jgi:hypothetical protein
VIAVRSEMAAVKNVEGSGGAATTFRFSLLRREVAEDAFGMSVAGRSDLVDVLEGCGRGATSDGTRGMPELEGR